MRFPSGAIGAVVLAALFIGIVADDADARRRRFGLGSGIHPGQKPHGPMLSRDELHHCLSLQDAIDAQHEMIDETAQGLAEQRPLLDRTNAVAVAEFNEVVSAYNRDVRSADADVASFNERCAGKAYYVRDLPGDRPAKPKEPKPRELFARPATEEPQTVVTPPTMTCRPDSVLGPMVCR